MKQLQHTIVVVTVAMLVLPLVARAQSPVQMMDQCNSSGGRWVWSPDQTYGSCQRAGASGGSASANAMVSSAYQMGAAIGQALNQWAANAAQQAAQKRAFEQALQRQREQAAQQHRLEEARRLSAMIDRLEHSLKLEGLPQLALKLDDAGSGNSNCWGQGDVGLPGRHVFRNDIFGGCPPSDSGLKLKLGDDATSAQGYGIPGLPGVATHGPREEQAPPEAASGLRLKLGGAAGTGSSDAGTASGTANGAFGQMAQPTIPPGGMTPEQAAQIFAQLPPDQQEKIMAQLEKQGPGAVPNVSSGGGTFPQNEHMGETTADQVGASQPGASTSTAPPGGGPSQAGKSLQNSTAFQQLQQMAGDSRAAVTASTPEVAATRAGAGFDGAAKPSPGALSITTPAGPSSAATHCTGSADGSVNLGCATTDVVDPARVRGTATASLTAPAAMSTIPSGPGTATGGAVVTPPNSDLQFLFRQPGSWPGPADPNAPLRNPLRDEQDVQIGLFSSQQHADDANLAINQDALYESLLRGISPALADRYLADPSYAAAVKRDLAAVWQQLEAKRDQQIRATQEAAFNEMSGTLNRLKQQGLITDANLAQKMQDDPAVRAQLQGARDQVFADQADAIKQINDHTWRAFQAQAGRIAASDGATIPPQNSDVQFLFSGSAPRPAAPDVNKMIVNHLTRSAMLDAYAPGLGQRYDRDADFSNRVDRRLDAAQIKMAAERQTAIYKARQQSIQDMGPELDKLRASGLLKPGVSLQNQEQHSPELRNAIAAARERVLAKEQAAERQADIKLRQEMEGFYRQLAAQETSNR